MLYKIKKNYQPSMKNTIENSNFILKHEHSNSLKMIHFFGNENDKVFAIQTNEELSSKDISKLTWLFGNQKKINAASLGAFFIGPRVAMISPDPAAGGKSGERINHACFPRWFPALLSWCFWSRSSRETSSDMKGRARAPHQNDKGAFPEIRGSACLNL